MTTFLLLALSAWSAASAEPRMFYTMIDPKHRLVLADEKGLELKTIPGISGDQQWSPDGSRILLTVDGEGYDPDLIAVTGLDLKPRQIQGQPYGFEEVPDFSNPVWSADGRSILAREFREGVVAMGVDEATVKILCPHPEGYNIISVQPSPDGKKIAFTGYQTPFDANRNNDVFVMDGSCRNPLRLTSDQPQPSDLRWSRDGKRLAFIDRAGQPSSYKLIVIDADGQNRKEFKEGEHHSVSWGDDGRLLSTWTDRTNPDTKQQVSYLGIIDPATGLATVLRKGVRTWFGAAEWRPRPKKTAAPKAVKK